MSTGPEPSSSVRDISSVPQCENTAFGRGANTKVNAVIVDVQPSLSNWKARRQEVRTNEERQPICP
jgi:hypothetical protein